MGILLTCFKGIHPKTGGDDVVVVNNRLCLPEATVRDLHRLLGKVLGMIEAKKLEIAAELAN